MAAWHCNKRWFRFGGIERYLLPSGEGARRADEGFQVYCAGFLMHLPFLQLANGFKAF